MKKIIKNVALGLVFSSSFLTALPAFCEEGSAVEFEKALMKYILAYEALQKAKLDPSKASKLPKYMKKYRESYAQYLELLHESQMYNPDNDEEENDPAGNFNKKQEDKDLPKKKFETVNTSAARNEIKEKVTRGDDIDSLVDETATSHLPANGYASIDYAAYGFIPNLFTLYEGRYYGPIPPGYKQWNPRWKKPSWWGGEEVPSPPPATSPCTGNDPNSGNSINPDGGDNGCNSGDGGDDGGDGFTGRDPGVY